jgi:quercetin dioxygenase-like cupin family protein
MNEFKVNFDSMEWQSRREGARFKLFQQDSRQLRLVEFTSGEVDPHWCSQGHIGFVLSGGLQIDIGGRIVSYVEGDGIFIPSGQATAHKACSITPGTRIVMVEEISDGASGG